MARKQVTPIVIEDDEPKTPGVYLPPVEDFVRVMSDTFQREFNHDDFSAE